MNVYEVKQGARVCHLTIHGSTAVKFDASFRGYIIENKGDGLVLASVQEEVMELEDGVYVVGDGESVSINFVRTTDTLYLKGDGDVTIYAQNIPYMIKHSGSVEYVPEGDIEETTREDVDELFNSNNVDNTSNEGAVDFIDELFK